MSASSASEDVENVVVVVVLLSHELEDECRRRFGWKTAEILGRRQLLLLQPSLTPIELRVYLFLPPDILIECVSFVWSEVLSECLYINSTCEGLEGPTNSLFLDYLKISYNKCMFIR